MKRSGLTGPYRWYHERKAVGVRAQAPNDEVHALGSPVAAPTLDDSASGYELVEERLQSGNEFWVELKLAGEGIGRHRAAR